MARDVALQGNGTLTLTGSSQALVAANPSRREIIISNNSVANPMYLVYDEPALTSTGPIVTPAAVVNTGLRLAKEQTVVESEYKGAIRIIGTNTDIVSWIEV